MTSIRLLDILLHQWAIIGSIPTGGYTVSLDTKQKFYVHVEGTIINRTYRTLVSKDNRRTILNHIELLLSDTRELTGVVFEALLDVRNVNQLKAAAAEKGKEVNIADALINTNRHQLIIQRMRTLENIMDHIKSAISGLKRTEEAYPSDTDYKTLLDTLIQKMQQFLDSQHAQNAELVPYGYPRLTSPTASGVAKSAS